MSWPYSPRQCPRCRYLEPFEPPIEEDNGYLVAGFCTHPRIAMDLFLLHERDPATLEPCPFCSEEER